MSKVSFLVVVSILLLNNGFCDRPKLKIDVLYESLCPDSLHFITQELHPIWNEVSPFVNLTLIPFGKSLSLENGIQFQCQHGPRECKGNRIQSCALNLLQDQNLQVEYVNCFMKTFMANRDENEFGQKCAVGVGLDFQDVYNCYQTSKGTHLQLLAEKRTLQIKPRFIPTILYNRIFNQELQDASFENFRDTTCEVIKSVYPKACKRRTLLRL